MNVPEIRAALSAGRRVFGTLVASTAPVWPAHLRSAGLDFVFLDTEHIAIGRETLSWMCRAYAGAGLAPVVRIPAPDPFAACGALDGGAAGVVAPYVETAGQVQALRGAVKFRPLKGRRLERILAGQERPEPELAAYLAARNRDSLLLVNIESLPAVENLDAILAVPDLDGVVIGPHDLSCSLGLPERYQHPRFTEALRTIVGEARGRGLIAGVHFMACGPVELAAEWLRLGVNLHIQHADVYYAARGVREDLQALRAAVGERPAGAAENINV
jgi:4-hydroxy-2-oxoheptanedioate aldolase